MSPPLRHMALATFFYSLMALQIKFLSHLPVWEIVFFRAGVTFILCLLALRRKGMAPWGQNRKLLVLRGLFGTLAMCGVFTTFAHMPLATASTLTKLAPLFAAVLAALFLGERIGWKAWCCYGLAFAGVVMVKGFDPEVEMSYFLLGIAAALCASLAYNCIAKLKESEDPLVIMFYFPLVTIPLTVIPTYQSWVQPMAWEFALLMSIGCTVQIAQYFMTRAYQSGAPGRVSIVSYFGIVLVLLYDVLIFEKIPSLGSLGGMVLVVLGVGLAVFLKREPSAH